jgi:hypothetical protein
MPKGSGEVESFARSIDRHRELPDDTGQGANADLPQLFGRDFPIPTGESVIDNLPQARGRSGGTSLFNFPDYNFTAHLKRFYMSSTAATPDEMGNVEYSECDDSAAYEDLLNRMLTGKAIPRWEDRTVLKDGTMIITVCYMQPHKKKKSPRVHPPDRG